MDDSALQSESKTQSSACDPLLLSGDRALRVNWTSSATDGCPCREDRASAQAQGQSQAYPISKTSKPNDKTEWEIEWELQGLEMDPEDLIALQEEPVNPEINPEIHQLNERMSQMEEMLSQIVQHLQKPSTAA